MHMSAAALAVLAMIITPILAQTTRTPPPKPTLSTQQPGPTPTGGALPASCTTRPVATWYKTSGCEVNCNPTLNCIADFALVLPCGCTLATAIPTTTTICPTRTPCVQCQTGWGLITVTDPSCSKPTGNVAPRVLPAMETPVAVKWMREM
ncbi:hypothetical protein QBC35DRAFT_449499 [Podospora australis]|uniref:Extracellular membrane protein CFEM domain-containing protein n=1 Tax=Podospora australis TaxID=1536484 RepID=A0AAN6X2I8_9PEZI|nr:hypothetical protein QBC35DRAFT_449499 [Podospora australis]